MNYKKWYIKYKGEIKNFNDLEKYRFLNKKKDIYKNINTEKHRAYNILYEELPYYEKIFSGYDLSELLRDELELLRVDYNSERLGIEYMRELELEIEYKDGHEDYIIQLYNGVCSEIRKRKIAKFLKEN